MGSGAEDDDRDDAADSEPADKSERRAGVRHLACFPAEIQADPSKGARTAIIRDLSVTGALLLTGAKAKVGDTVSLNLYISGDETAHTVVGKIVRHERRDPASAGLWPFSVAVQFDAPLTHLEEQIKEVAHRQAVLLGRKETA